MKKKRTVLSIVRSYIGETCTESTEWMGGYTDPQKAWDECPDGYWMLFLLRELQWLGLAGTNPCLQVIWDLWYSDVGGEQDIADLVRKEYPVVPKPKKRRVKSA